MKDWFVWVGGLGVDRFDLVRGLDRLLREGGVGASGGFRQSEGGPPAGQDRPAPHGLGLRGALGATLRQAEHEANELGDDYVGSEHLVLAIVDLADAILTALLQQHGISHKQVKEKVISLLRTEGQRSRPRNPDLADWWS